MTATQAHLLTLAEVAATLRCTRATARQSMRRAGLLIDISNGGPRPIYRVDGDALGELLVQRAIGGPNRYPTPLPTPVRKKAS